MTWRPGKLDDYDDEQAVRWYIDSYWHWHMTEFEKRCESIGAIREKAKVSSFRSLDQRSAKAWTSADDAVRSALSSGLNAFLEGVRTRIFDEFGAGTLVVNRCPRCGRVVRTPRARQCLWCAHDWHFGRDHDRA